MHKLSINFKESVDENEIWHQFYNLLSYLRHSGQLVGRYMEPYLLDGKISATIVTATSEALEPQFRNTYVVKSIAKLEELCQNKLEIEFVGYSEDQQTSVCTCKEKPPHYLMSYFPTFSPVQCGICYKSVPLYTLPKLKDDGFEPLTSWMSNMLACVLLDVNCTVGEKWAINQQSSPKSALSQQGLKVAELIREKTGLPCYYYLHNYAKRSPKKDHARPCPSCNGQWFLEKEIHRFIRFKCEICLLMSCETSNT